MTKQAIIHIEEGKYAIEVETLKKEMDEPSAMANYLSHVAIVTHQNDALYLTLMFTDHETISGFQVGNQTGDWLKAIDQQIDQENNKRAEMFELDHLRTPLHVRVQYEVKHGDQKITGDEELRLAFNEESLEKLD